MDIGVYCLAPIINLFGPPNNIKSNTFLLSTGVDGQGSAILDYGTMDAEIGRASCRERVSTRV